MAKSIKHPSHNCVLEASSLSNPYKCDGCQELGTGFRYRCSTCNFDLHYSCGSHTDASPLVTHSFHNKEGHNLQFFLDSDPPIPIFFPPCNACGESVCGFSYRCVSKDCGYVLHPCCAHISPTMTFPSVDNDMEITVSLSENLIGVCQWCGGSAPQWAYVTPSHDSSIHVACARKMSMLIEAASSGQALPAPTPAATSSRRSGRSGRLFLKLTVALAKGVTGVLTGDITAPVGAVADLFSN